MVVVAVVAVAAAVVGYDGLEGAVATVEDGVVDDATGWVVPAVESAEAETLESAPTGILTAVYC